MNTEELQDRQYRPQRRKNRISKPLTRDEIASAFADQTSRSSIPAILTENQASTLLHVPPKTIKNWRSAGRLNGIWAKPGRHVIYWRDRLVEWAFDEESNTWQP